MRVLIILVLLDHGVAFGGSDVETAIVKSSNNDYFNQTIQTLLNQADKPARFRIIDIQSDSDQLSQIANSDLIISLGAQATGAVFSRFPKKKLISAYLTAQQLNDYALPGQQHLAVLLDQPLERYVGFSHLLLKTKKIGLISFDPIPTDIKLQRFLLKNELELNQFQVRNPDYLLAVLRRLARQNSSLLMLPDHRLYNRKSLKGVLLTTYRSRLPVISYSPAHVKSGALASIYSSPENIGRHLGDLLNQFIKNKSLPAEDRLFARYYSIKTNRQVARALGLSLPDEEQLKLRLGEVLQ